ncbi:MAG: hypothetical protein ABSD64_11495 [Terriglobales bacterium]|jgi:hypothetical protein
MSEIVKAYALLSSLKQNLPNTFEVTKEWVDDYHSILDSVEKETGESLEEFRIPDGELHRQVTGGNYRTGITTYGKNIVVQRARFMLKVDAVLGYFQFQTPSPPDKQPIGFKKP